MQSLLLTPLDRWRAPAPAARRVHWLGEWDYAHRGLHGDAVPENSPSAFADAIGRGMGIELDVQRSQDGKAMVFHDWDFDRLTDDTGPVAKRDAAAIETIMLAGSSDTIRTLNRTLDQIGGRVPVLIEVKSAEDRRIFSLCLAVQRALEGYRGLHAVMSFDPRVARWFARHSQHTVRGLVVTEDGQRGLLGRWRRHLALWHARPDFLAYDIRDLPSAFAASQRGRGMPVLSWTVKTAELRERAERYADAPIAEGDGAA